MIPLNPLRILIEGNHTAVGIGFIMPPGLPVSIGIVGFENKEELLEVANCLYQQVIYLYESWDKLGLDIPEAFKRAFDEEEG